MTTHFAFLLNLMVIFGSTSQPARIYTTGFQLAENPISDRDNWINGKTNGLDWSNISTDRGLATGHQKGDVHYADATALLTGSWTADQTAQAFYINGVQVAQATDSTFRSGNPGMGLNFDYAGAGASMGTNNGYGFTGFTASDNVTND